MSEEQNVANTARSLRGRVISDKMMKACVVAVERRVQHPIYGKVLTKTTKFHVADPNNEAHEGDLVEIVEGRPVSKTISWRLSKVVEKASRA
ncbi:MAG: 30S ribosomal protein S17 [Succinatimonas hippei]|nr:30S ribosomal protein S17 [Succinatimonas hippei]